MKKLVLALHPRTDPCSSKVLRSLSIANVELEKYPMNIVYAGVTGTDERHRYRR